MLYLIKLDAAYKIGFTDSLKTRINSYRVSNVTVELVSFREGSRIDEEELHKILKEYSIRGGELYELKEEIPELFSKFINNPDQEKDRKILELQKENHKLKEDLKYYYNRQVIKDTLPDKEVEHDTLFKGKVVKIPIKFFKEYISFGDCLIYNRLLDLFLNEYNAPAKLYNILGKDMYYVISGVALEASIIKNYCIE